MTTFLGVPSVSSGFLRNHAIVSLGGGLRPPSDGRRTPRRGVLLPASTQTSLRRQSRRSNGAWSCLYPQRRFQGRNKLRHLVDEGGVTGVTLDESDDGGADDDAVGELADGGDLLGSGDAEADTDRLGGDQAQRADLGVELGRELAALTRDAEHGDDVDEAAAQSRDDLHARR